MPCYPLEEKGVKVQIYIYFTFTSDFTSKIRSILENLGRSFFAGKRFMCNPSLEIATHPGHACPKGTFSKKAIGLPWVFSPL